MGRGEGQSVSVSRDPLGDRMKAYEGEFRLKLPRRSLSVIRLDGRAFHSWTRGLKRPYDERLITAFADVTQKLCEEVSGSVIAYTQSDEISILMQDFESEKTQPWFGGGVQKIVSVASSFATAHFASHFPDRGPAFFDARVLSFPNKVEALNYFVWRQKDARRNAVSMIAESYLSPKQLHGLSTDERRKAIEQRGVDLTKEDPRFMMGQVIERKTVLKPVTYTRKDTGEEITTDPVKRRVWDAGAAGEFKAREDSWMWDRIPEPPNESE